MEFKVDDFIVDTKGYCFLCLNKIKLISEQFVQVQSIQYLSRYLKLDMSKVFQGPVPQDLLAKVERSRLKVELCSECINLNDKLSELLRLLEKTELDIAFRLSCISDKLNDSENSHKLHEIKSSVFGNHVSEANVNDMIEKLEIAQILRKETNKKCSLKVLNSVPKVNIDKVNLKSIKKTKRAVNNDDIKAENSSSPVSIKSNYEIASVEFNDFDNALDMDVMEEPDSDDSLNSSSPLIKSTKTAKVETFKGNSFSRVQKKYKKFPTTVPPPIKSEKWIKYGSFVDKIIFNSENGKYRCRQCSREFNSRYSATRHIKTIHMKLYSRCPACGKSFIHKTDYEIHYKARHLGVRQQCHLCKETFYTKSNLARHIKNVHK